jgi:hypothetical protein
MVVVVVVKMTKAVIMKIGLHGMKMIVTSMMLFHASSGYKPPENRQMPVSTHKFLMLFFSATF